MKPMIRILLAAAAVAMAFAPTAPVTAQDKPSPTATKVLGIGDPAPALDIAEWVKGNPVPKFEPGKVYVVEFWATWCGPCIQAMPHLSELQKKFADKGVTIIGVTSEDPGNSLAAVKKMVADKGDVIAYTVAWDSGRSTNERFMKAARQQGIPTSFVIDRTGNVAYIGHPSTLDGPLEKIIAGTWDPAAARAQAENERLLEELEAKFDAAMAAEDEKGAYAAIRALWNGPAKDNPEVLNLLAWTIVDPEGPMKSRDYPLAIQMAEHAVELTKAQDAAILDTLAVAYEGAGQIDKAIDLQTKAVGLAGDPALKAELQKALDRMKAKKAAAK